MKEYSSNQTAYFYSIHTLELGFRLNRHTYDMLINFLITYSINYNFCYYTPETSQTILVFDMFKKFGFTYCYAQQIHAKNQTFCSYCFYMIINPRKLFQIPDHHYICITPPEKTKDIIPYIIALFQSLGIDFMDFESSLFVKRLDFCTNIKMDNAEMTKEYMRLLCKGKHIFRSHRKLQYSQIGHRQVCPTHDFTITGHSFELSIYNKKKQMESSSFSYPDSEQELANNQIRIELRIFYPKLYHLKQSYGATIELFNHIPELSQEYIDKYLLSTYGKGDFYQYKDAVNKILSSPFRKSTQSNMIAFMKKISKTTLQEASDFFSEQDNYPGICFILNKFNELNLSPITLSRKSHYTMLHHPIYYIHSRNVNLCPSLD